MACIFSVTAAFQCLAAGGGRLIPSERGIRAAQPLDTRSNQDAGALLLGLQLRGQKYYTNYN